MALAPSKHTAPLTTDSEITAQWKRKASSRITDENFVGAESNAVTKCLKHAAQAASVKHQRRQPSVEDVEDEGSAPVNSSPKNQNALLEAVDGSDDVEMLENCSASALEDFEEDGDEKDEPEVTKPVETAEVQLSESRCGKKSKP